MDIKKNPEVIMQQMNTFSFEEDIKNLVTGLQVTSNGEVCPNYQIIITVKGSSVGYHFIPLKD